MPWAAAKCNDDATVGLVRLMTSQLDLHAGTQSMMMSTIARCRTTDMIIPSGLLHYTHWHEANFRQDRLRDTRKPRILVSEGFLQDRRRVAARRGSREILTGGNRSSKTQTSISLAQTDEERKLKGHAPSVPTSGHNRFWRRFGRPGGGVSV